MKLLLATTLLTFALSGAASAGEIPTMGTPSPAPPQQTSQSQDDLTQTSLSSELASEGINSLTNLLVMLSF
jgi:hypothetical protein